MQKQHLLIDDEVRSIFVKDNQVYFSDTNELVPEKYLKGFKSVLNKPEIGYKYNAKLFSILTSTPYAFWYSLDEAGQEKAMDILYSIIPDLQRLRESRLKEFYAKRSKRANRIKSEKSKQS